MEACSPCPSHAAPPTLAYPPGTSRTRADADGEQWAMAESERRQSRSTALPIHPSLPPTNHAACLSCDAPHSGTPHCNLNRTSMEMPVSRPPSQLAEIPNLPYLRPNAFPARPALLSCPAAPLRWNQRSQSPRSGPVPAGRGQFLRAGDRVTTWMRELGRGGVGMEAGERRWCSPSTARQSSGGAPACPSSVAIPRLPPAKSLLRSPRRPLRPWRRHLPSGPGRVPTWGGGQEGRTPHLRTSRPRGMGGGMLTSLTEGGLRPSSLRLGVTTQSRPATNRAGCSPSSFQTATVFSTDRTTYSTDGSLCGLAAIPADSPYKIRCFKTLPSRGAARKAQNPTPPLGNPSLASPPAYQRPRRGLASMCNLNPPHASPATGLSISFPALVQPTK